MGYNIRQPFLPCLHLDAKTLHIVKKNHMFQLSVVAERIRSVIFKKKLIINNKNYLIILRSFYMVFGIKGQKYPKCSVLFSSLTLLPDKNPALAEILFLN